MCGIAVAIDWEGAVAAVASMQRGVAHRGDVSDPIISPRSNTAMGTRRLRIVDADRGVQPQFSFDGNLAVSFNGEIYNHAELRRELELLGIVFQTDSDTEVLANALQVWGAKALSRLNGMFAFVAIDIGSGEFLAARDPFGVKPLYVIQSDTGFLFCSEIRPLLKAAEKGDVFLLPPGYLLTRKFCAGYKSALGGPFGGKEQGNSRTLDKLLRDAVECRIPADLPFATMLSGGIDSTLVAHYASALRPEAPAYFLGGKNAPDYVYAAAYAEMSGTDLRMVPFEPDCPETLARIAEIVAVSESFEPSVVRGAVCSHAVSQAIHRDGYNVALCGDGADELFVGYRPLELAFQENEDSGRSVRNECLAQMHSSCLQRVDRCSMNFELEVREPFLDPSIAAYALNLHPSALIEQVNGQPRGKKPLRDLYDLYPNELPQLIRHRSKVLFDEGAGLDANPSVWMAYFEDCISDAAFREGVREFAPYNLRTKEELFYIRALSQSMDVSRVPSLRGRISINLSAGVLTALAKAA